MATNHDALKLEFIGRLESAQTGEGGVLRPEIQEAFEQARRLPFPHRKMEEWKYSPFPVPAQALVPASAPSSLSLMLDRGPFGDACLLVWVNGFFEPALSDSALPEGVSLHPSGFGSMQLSGYAPSLFSSLQEATCAVQGLHIRVEKNACPNQPLGLLFITTGEAGTWSQPCLRLEAGEKSQLQVCCHSRTEGSEGQVVNAFTEVIVKDGASVNWSEFQETGTGIACVQQTRVETGKNAVFGHLIVSTGTGYIRNNLEIQVKGEGAEVHMNGLTLGKENFHADHHTFVNHKPENTTSNQLYKGIFGGKSTGVFNGKILVDQPAQKTNAYQSGKNLLLSADARVFAKPQLEIFADDVKCSHGATIGQPDEEPVFYLRSRGLDLKSARMLLLNAFASEIVMKIGYESFRKFAGDRVAEELQLLTET